MTATKSPDSPWRPIESAPKDGTRVLLGNDCDMQVCRWGHYSLFQCGEDWIYGEAQGEYNAHETFDDPTHWMPAPPLPERS